ncbi:hypothetical protein AGMMS49543_20780 [Betaproteobacteria bacterium]|nr:hypothetical protein AGMMS49543_20780 [Betaproteobacteria bacterium]
MSLTNKAVIAAISVAAITLTITCFRLFPKNTSTVIIPKDAQSVVETKQNQVTITQKKVDQKTGQVEVTQVKKYKAPEAKALQVTKEDGTTEVKVQTHGLCHTAEATVLYGTDGLSIGAGIKWGWWNRFSSSVGVHSQLAQFTDWKHLHSDLYVSLDVAVHNNSRLGVYYSPLTKSAGLRFSMSF